MAATSDDGVPQVATATGHGDIPDGDTTAAATAPATRGRSPPSTRELEPPEDASAADDDDERTVQQPVDPKIKNAARDAVLAGRVPGAAPPTPPAPTPPTPPAPPAPPVRITSKKMTAVGLGPVLSPAQRAAQQEAAVAPPPQTPVTPSMAKGPPTTEPSAGAPAPPSTPELEADAQDDSITATAPAPRVTPSQAASTGVTVPLPPLSVPGAVKIRTLGVDDADDPMDETEVRTLVTQPSEAVATALANATKPLPAAGRPPSSAGPPTSSSPSPTASRAQDVGEADEPDDSVTTQAPSPLSRIPTDDEPKTSPPMKLSPAGVRPQAASTTQEQAAPDDDDEPKTSPPLAAPIPAAGRRPSDPGDFYANSDDSEDSVTTRGPALNPEEYEDDSVTAQGPVTRAPTQQSPALLAALELPPALEEGTEGTTKKVAKRNQIIPKTLLSPAAPEELPADTEKGSITAEAPGPLTNMLRVIATPGDDSGSGAIVKDDDLEEENKTAVMLGAPVKPGAPAGSSRGLRAATQLSSGSGVGGARAAAIADLREPSSDSGLRIARAEEPSGDHASLDALLGVNGAKHDSGVGPALVDHGSANMKSRDGSPSPFANTEKAFPPMNMPGSASHIPVPGNGAAALDARASAHNLDFAATLKKPRYGLLVGFVAVLSIAIPLILFLWLKSAGENAMARTPSEVVADPVPRGDPARAKGKPGASGAPSSSHSGRGGGGSSGGWSIRRH